jgi:oxygen-dependent protoporphyrinogen oxidase
VSASNPQLAPRIAVIGGGISGLAAAHRLTQLLPAAEVRVFEAGPRLGGSLFTIEHDGAVSEQRAVSGQRAVFEQGADSFLTKDSLPLDLCRELGLEDEVIPTNEAHRRALVVSQGRLVPVPEGFVLMQPRQLLPLMHSPALSALGKLRAVAEPSVPKLADVDQPDYDESVASFATRRLGLEAFERLVEPLIAGIFVADATKLSLAATYPEFIQAERNHGSLWHAWQNRRGLSPFAQSAEQTGTVPLPTRFSRYGEPSPFPASRPEDSESGARYGAFVTLRGGLGRLTGALTEALTARLQPRALPGGSPTSAPDTDPIALNHRITSVERLPNARWRITDAKGHAEDFDGVIITLPARQTATLVQRVDNELTSALARINAASSVVATLLYRREQITRPLDGFGLVVPRVENRQIVAASFPSVKFPGRSPEGLVPVRVFLGGALRPDMIDRDDADLITIARQELASLIGAHGEPATTFVAHWREAMPQCHVGHLALVDAIEARVAALPGLELAGNSYRGVGIPQSLRSGRTAAEHLASTIANKPSAPGSARG